ncbi:hypothetical protein CBM2589_A90273 [Cupriavidus taiwanensis]|uniref:Uncharacterized protein n=1 Tax=Cupriavidus taiwanensis TaxID=164546 RepID=A0A975XFT3_9BURK|nr:hypothetical protein CBM2589_A90273 [Cupriavidus taiwanensis]
MVFPSGEALPVPSVGADQRLGLVSTQFPDSPQSAYIVAPRRSLPCLGPIPATMAGLDKRAT